jgi:hypothetical protein
VVRFYYLTGTYHLDIIMVTIYVCTKHTRRSKTRSNYLCTVLVGILLNIKKVKVVVGGHRSTDRSMSFRPHKKSTPLPRRAPIQYIRVLLLLPTYLP